LANTDQPFDQVLMYLRAAGHDTGQDTRERLQRFIREQREANPSLGTSLLMENVPKWFDLPTLNPAPQLPPIARNSIGYPDE
jgi:hypothetical protein